MQKASDILTKITSGHTIKDDGISLTQRPALDFHGFVVEDDLPNNKTVITNLGGDTFGVTKFNQKGVRLTGTGAQLLLTPASGKRIKLFRFDLTSSILIGTTSVYLGSTNIFTFLTVKQGGVYGANLTSNPITGAIDETITVVLPTTCSICTNITWLEV